MMNILLPFMYNIFRPDWTFRTTRVGWVWNHLEIASVLRRSEKVIIQLPLKRANELRNAGGPWNPSEGGQGYEMWHGRS